MTRKLFNMLKKEFAHVKSLIINAMVFYAKYNQINLHK